MAALNGYGQILHGIGGGSASIDNVPFSVGAAGGWVEDHTAFFADGSTDAWVLALFNQTTGTRAPAVTDPTSAYYGASANTLHAGGEVWAAWLATGRTARGRHGRRGELLHVPYAPRPNEAAVRGLYASTGFAVPDGGLLGVGPDGTIGYKPDYHAGGPSVARAPNGAEWLITHGHAADLMLLGDTSAIWQEAQRIKVCGGLPQPLQVGSAWRPQAFLIAGRWWVAYFCDELGVVLHPFEVLEGYVLSPAGVNCWHYGRLLDGYVLRFALSSGEGEQPGQVRAHDVDWTLPMQPLEVVDPEPPVVEPPPVIEPPPIEPVDPVDPPVTPPVTPPITPIPLPPLEVDVLAAYGPVYPGFLPASEVDNGNGTISVLKPNGKYLCVTPEGKVEERDTPGGIWESFKKGSNCLIAERDGEAKGPQVFVLMAADL